MVSGKRGIFAAEIHKTMNVDRLLREYFKDAATNTIIEVFDTDNLYVVYQDIVKTLDKIPSIELSVLQSLAYCFYEVLDNVITHSKKKCGTAIVQHNPDKSAIKILVADDGIGIKESLVQNPKYSTITTEQALKLCVEDSVTDGNGMGYGLYSTLQLVHNGGSRLIIRSCDKVLDFDGQTINIKDSSFWQGTIVYFEINSDKEIDSQLVFNGKADVESDYEQLIEEDSDLYNLW